MRATITTTTMIASPLGYEAVKRSSSAYWLKLAPEIDR
jgi:hypothetical protein